MGPLQLVCLLCVATVCVEADYRLEVLFLSFNNPTGMCGDPRCAANQGCCDDPPHNSSTLSCAGQCAYHPRFCVRPLGTTSNSSSDCLQTITGTATAISAPNDFFTFVTGNDDFFGTPNPAVFTGPRWPGGIQLFMEVYDIETETGFDGELVDRFAVDVNVSVGSNITINSTGVFGLMQLQVNFRVMCVEDFFVLDCATCSGVNRDPSTNCSTCLTGYGGSDCTVVISGTPSSGTPSSGTLLAPVIGGVVGGMLLLVIIVVILTVATWMCVRQRNAVLKDQPPPQEDIDLKPNPVYGVAGSDHPSPQEDINVKPNPVYGVAGLQESQLDYYYAWDHIHKTSADINDTYEYVN